LLESDATESQQWSRGAIRVSTASTLSTAETRLGKPVSLEGPLAEHSTTQMRDDFHVLVRCSHDISDRDLTCESFVSLLMLLAEQHYRRSRSVLEMSSWFETCNGRYSLLKKNDHVTRLKQTMRRRRRGLDMRWW
jgi:hypothetical protein